MEYVLRVFWLGKPDITLMPPPAMPDQVDNKPKKRLDTPLAAMLPSKYENTDVTELFPDFRHDKVQCFKLKSSKLM